MVDRGMRVTSDPGRVRAYTVLKKIDIRWAQKQYWLLERQECQVWEKTCDGKRVGGGDGSVNCGDGD